MTAVVVVLLMMGALVLLAPKTPVDPDIDRVLELYEHNRRMLKPWISPKNDNSKTS